MSILRFLFVEIWRKYWETRFNIFIYSFSFSLQKNKNILFFKENFFIILDTFTNGYKDNLLQSSSLFPQELEMDGAGGVRGRAGRMVHPAPGQGTERQ